MNERTETVFNGPETEMGPLKYICPTCYSDIEIISINDKLDEIELRCFNQDNPHRMKISIKDYLNKINLYQSNESVSNKCSNHNNCDYEYYCLNCDKHLCKVCLESREHLYHIKFNIMSEISLTEQEENLINNFICNFKNKTNNNNQKDNNDKYNAQTDIKNLICIVYKYYSFNKNNYYLAINLFNIIICCCKNDEDLKNELGFKEDDLNKFMKLSKNYFINNIEAELKLIVDTFNKKMEELNQNKNSTIEKINLEKREEYKEGKYIGEFNQGLKEGRGKFEYKNGDIYVGDWKNDKREGKGIYYFKNGNKYEGEFKNDKQDGKGIFFYGCGKYAGEKYEGDYKNGRMDGNGIYWFSNGDRQMGYYKQGKAIGKHALITVNNEIIKTDY